nr:Chain E, Calmodulin-regulated spectrin-associated protein [Mus musculus]5OW5_F Chain F, Calmodulin-regulated spectrin-associated protein [Mus musculus]
IEEALQIIHS